MTPNAMERVELRYPDSVVARRTTHLSLEQRGERSQAGVANLETNFRDRHVALRQQLLRRIDPTRGQEIVRSLAKRLRKKSMKVKRRQASFSGSRVQRDRLAKALRDQVAGTVHQHTRFVLGQRYPPRFRLHPSILQPVNSQRLSILAFEASFGAMRWAGGSPFQSGITCG